ncbi:MAG: UbiX family flavin prenyltransferase [Campylobacteraceae bacterium]|jgi:4-hydroxy-3-polyprenylbenzoate decarboxylase|nr:UbiX family flavin prenyltransferase [Campylobacteraceae bacterium]
MKKIIVGISGASGVRLGLKFLHALPEEYKAFVIATNSAKIVSKKEENFELLDNSDISERTASGSFGADMMAVIPCSMNTLAKIAVGIADNLLTRSAAVMIKEQKKLLLAPREMPYCAISLSNMHTLAQNRVIIAPPVVGFYADIKTLEDMEDFLIGRWFDLLGIPNDLYKRWSGE